MINRIDVSVHSTESHNDNYASPCDYQIVYDEIWQKFKPGGIHKSGIVHENFMLLSGKFILDPYIFVCIYNPHYLM